MPCIRMDCRVQLVHLLSQSRCGVLDQHRLHGSYPFRLHSITPGWGVVDVKQMADNLFYMRPCLGRVAFTLDPVRGVAFVLGALCLQVSAPHVSVVLAFLLCTHAVTSRRDNNRKVDDDGLGRGGQAVVGGGEGVPELLVHSGSSRRGERTRSVVVSGRPLLCAPGFCLYTWLPRAHLFFVSVGICCVCPSKCKYKFLKWIC